MATRIIVCVRVCEGNEEPQGSSMGACQRGEHFRSLRIVVSLIGALRLFFRYVSSAERH